MITLFLFSAIISCVNPAHDEKQDEKSRIVVFVSNYPLYAMTQQISGGKADILFPAEGQGDPAYWNPEPEEIAQIQEADLILINGATYEKWMGNISIPESSLVNTSKGFKDKYISLKEATTHSHGPEGEHEHTGTAFTTWLDLTLAAEQAYVVKNALIKLLPDEEKNFEEAYLKLKNELMDLDKELTAITSADHIHVIFSHPVYQYFSERYNVHGSSLHWEPDIIPDGNAWSELEHELDHQAVKWMIWESQPLPEVAERLGEMGVSVIVYDPCSNVPEVGDFLSVMKNNINSLRNIYQ